MALITVTPRKCLKFTLVIAFVVFLIINTTYLWSPSNNVKVFRENPSVSEVEVETAASKTSRNAPVTEEEVEAPVKSAEDKLKNASVNTDLDNSDSSSARRDSALNESLSFIIDDINREQKIRNVDKFPPNGNNSYKHVFVVQVHNRDHYLKPLVHSLERMKGVNNSLLIISHDYYSKEVFDVVEEITFMPVLQIFYPFAMQLYRNRFPGPDPEDCPRDIKKPEALKRRCVNAEHPDLYGHYREASYSQTKLHWFWKLHRVFDGLNIMKSFNGYVTLIEEDHYVTPDALHMLQLMIAAQPTLCSKCRILTLGNYDKKPSYTFTREVVAAADFISSKHNMAMSFNRTIYNIIKDHKEDFCNFDDYNWDWSMQYIGKDKIPGKLPTLIVKTPRVHHIGECGVHHKNKAGKCDPILKTEPVDKLVSANQDKLFPPEIKLGKPTSATFIAAKKMKPNGGWGDLRDHELCISFMDDDN